VRVSRDSKRGARGRQGGGVLHLFEEAELYHDSEGKKSETKRTAKRDAVHRRNLSYSKKKSR